MSGAGEFCVFGFVGSAAWKNHLENFAKRVEGHDAAGSLALPVLFIQHKCSGCSRKVGQLNRTHYLLMLPPDFGTNF